MVKILRSFVGGKAFAKQRKSVLRLKLFLERHMTNTPGSEYKTRCALLGSIERRAVDTLLQSINDKC